MAVIFFTKKFTLRKLIVINGSLYYLKKNKIVIIGYRTIKIYYNLSIELKTKEKREKGINRNCNYFEYIVMIKSFIRNFLFILPVRPSTLSYGTRVFNVHLATIRRTWRNYLARLISLVCPSNSSFPREKGARMRVTSRHQKAESFRAFVLLYSPASAFPI